MSLNQFIAAAVAEKVGVIETAREFLERRAGQAKPKGLPKYLRTRDSDPRDVFTRHLDLPRGPDREIVRDRDREYTLRGSEIRTLATVGAFRVVSSRDLHEQQGRPFDPRSSDLRHLREQETGGRGDRHGERVLTWHCRHCGAAFEPTRRHQAFCRPSCRLSHFKAKPQPRLFPSADPDELFRVPFE